MLLASFIAHCARLEMLQKIIARGKGCLTKAANVVHNNVCGMFMVASGVAFKVVFSGKLPIAVLTFKGLLMGH